MGEDILVIFFCTQCFVWKGIFPANSGDISNKFRYFPEFNSARTRCHVKNNGMPISELWI